MFITTPKWRNAGIVSNYKWMTVVRNNKSNSGLDFILNLSHKINGKPAQCILVKTRKAYLHLES